MTIIRSKTIINRPVHEIYSFLSDFNNHQQLMPDSIYNWSSTKEEARFTIQNMAKLALKISSLTPDKEIVIVPAEKAPFDMELKWILKDNEDGTTEAEHIISADLNMMMKMLANGPLQKLADQQTTKMQTIYS